MNIYDCFTYFDEDMVLDLRLNVLNKYVKKFIISEATYTHKGTKKDLRFDINKFKKFKDKIEYVVVDKEPPNILTLNSGENIAEKDRKIIFYYHYVVKYSEMIIYHNIIYGGISILCNKFGQMSRSMVRYGIAL